MTDRTPRPRRWALFALLAIVGIQLQVLTALPASAAVCTAAFQGNPGGSLTISATVPDGGTIQAGQSITITITWNTADWTDLDQFHSCFQLNGADVDSLNFSEIPPTNDGFIQHTISVPNNVVDGDELCSRSRLSGQPASGNTTTQKSNKLCWTVGSAPQDPDVIVRKSASRTTVTAGESFDYTLEAENIGTGVANNVMISDTLPASLTVTSLPGNCSGTTTITCDLGSLDPGQVKSVTFTVETSDGSCPKVDNFGTVSASNEPSANTGNNVSNTVTVNVTCPDPDVSIRKASGAPAAGVEPGERFTYTITVENVGGADATGVTITDVLPGGLDFVSASAGCTENNGTVTCSIGTLAAGAKASVDITVEATENACPEVTNQATVSATNEPNANTGNNTSNAVTDNVNCREPGIAVRITKTNDANGDGIYTDSEEAKRSGLDVPFRLVITNTGETTWRITDLTDEFDQTVLDLLDSKCANLAGAELDPGESITCEFVIRNYSPPAETTLENTAEVCVRMVGGDLTDCDRDPSRVRSAEVLGRTVTKTPPGGTAFTGSGSGTFGFGLLAIALLMLGTGMMWAGYRKRASYDG
jgi:uncharacterized repeat protein (TIGR01451 family)